ncbi:MAG: hypothetical protein ACK5OX_06935 [Desertimonas sp.]
MAISIAASAAAAVVLLGALGATSPPDTATTEPTSSTSPASARPASELDTGDGYSVVGAIAELPARVLEDDRYLLSTANLEAAAEQAGLPSDDGDGLTVLTGDPRTRHGEAPPMFVQRPDWMLLAMDDPGRMREQVGWDLADVDAFAAISRPPPNGFTVVAGDFDDVLPESLRPLAPGVVTLGEGDDGEQHLGHPTALSYVGTPQRLAADDHRLAFGPLLDDVVAWEDDGAQRAVATDDLGVLAVANALDDAGAVSAVVAGMPRGEASAISVPIDVVGIGFAADDGRAVITVAYHVVEGGDHEQARGEIRSAFTTALSAAPGPPQSELVSVIDVVATGDAVVATLTVPAGESPGMMLSLLELEAAPFVAPP